MKLDFFRRGFVQFAVVEGGYFHLKLAT